MSDKIILVVSDEASDKYGEISVLDSAEQAERLVETLLEAGFNADKIKAFRGAPTEFVTTYRPVVHVTGDVRDGPAEPASPADGQSEREQPEAEPALVEAGNRNEASASANIFASLFRGARDDKLVITACDAAA